MSTDIEARLRRISNVIINQAKADDDFAEKLDKAISGTIRSVKRRDPPALDPVELFILSDENNLVEQLNALSEAQLKDIIACYRLDLTGRAMHWSKKDQLIHFIIESAKSRATKGDVFRA